MPEGIGLQPHELQRRAVRGVAWSAVSAAVTMPLAIGVSVVLARTLGSEGLARFALLAFAIPLLHGLTDAGFAQAVTREASRAFGAGDLDRTRLLLGKALGWNLARLPVVLAVTFAVARPSAWAAAALLACLVPTYLLSGLNFSINAENRGATMARLALLQAVAGSAVAIAAALGGASATTVWAFSYSASLVAVPGWLLAANPALRRAALRPRLPRGLPDRFWRYGAGALAASAGTTLVFSRSEILVLEAFQEQHALAVFALAYGLAQRLTTPVDTLLGPLIPALAALDAAHPDRLRAGFDRALRLAAAGTAFVCGAFLVGTALAGPALYGDEYHGVAAAFLALAAVSLVRAAAQPYTALAYALGRPGVVVRSLGIALALDVALAIGLVPVLGLWGAVAANVAGGLAATWLVAAAIPGRGSLVAAGVPLGRLAVVAGGGAAASALAALPFLSWHPAVPAAAALAAGALATLALARRRGVLTTPDADVVRSILPGPLGRVVPAASAPAGP